MSLVERLLRYTPGPVSASPRATDEEIAEIESHTGVTLPPDLREVLAWSNGFAIASTKTSFHLEDAHGLAYTQPDFDDDLPGMFVLGTDNGGSGRHSGPPATRRAGSRRMQLASGSTRSAIAARSTCGAGTPVSAWTR